MSDIIVRESAGDVPLDDVPHHYLRRLTSRRRPRRIICLDTEAARHTTDDGEVQTFSLAVASHDRTRNDSGHKPSTTWATFTDGPGELWEWITAQVPIRETVWVFAHNLQYDALVSDTVGQLKRLGWTLADVDAPGRLRSMRWHKGGRRMTLVDSWGLFRLPLDQLADLVGMAKLPMPGPGQRDGKWVQYCRRDVEVLRAAVFSLIDFLDDEDLGGFQLTLPALAWGAYRHRFMDTRPLVHRHAPVLALERDAYFGERAEVFAHGEQTGGRWEDWDIQMCYPYVAATTRLPFHYKGEVVQPSEEAYTRMRTTSAVLAEVTVTVARPLVPCRTAEGVSWPVGTFRTTLWDPELDLLREDGATIVWHSIHLYRRGTILQPFAQWCIDRLHGDDPEPDPLRRHLIKGMSRMLVGKLGQRSRRLEAVDVIAEKQWGEWFQTDPETGAVERLVAVDGKAYEIRTDGEVDNALPSMAGYITSAARVLLYNLILTVGRHNVVYCDTDGLILSADGVDRLEDAMHLGQLPPLVLKGSYRRVRAWGPQDIELDATHVIKGVPRSAERDGPDAFTVRHFSTWSEAIASGVLDSVTVTRRRIQLRRVYRRGWMLDDGAVWPLVVQWDGEVNQVLPWTSTPWCRADRTLTDPRQAAELGRSPP